MINYEQLLKKSKPYQTILKDKQNSMLGHCYMFITEDEIACKTLCRLACRVILCQNNDCGVCLNCQKVEDEMHSAVYKLADVKAEDIRLLINQSITAVNEGQTKVILIDNFQDISASNQNFLLKTLEEPNPNVVFILGVTQASAVLETIKSRCKKLYLDELNIQDIREELLQSNYNTNIIDKAVDCCFGNLTRAVMLLSDDEFVTNYSIWVGILSDMQTSKQVIEMSARLNINAINMQKYLDVLEIIFKAMLNFNTQVYQQGFEDLKPLSKVFNTATIVNIMELIIKCRKKLKSNCKPEAVAESLLMGILEVKYKCR